MEYGGFWRRLAALFLDFLILLPLMILNFMFNTKSFFIFMLFNFSFYVTGFILNIYFVKRYGGSPGKLILKLKIVKLDGSKAEWKEAILRSIVDYVFSTISSLMIINAIYNANINWGHTTMMQMNKAYSPNLPYLYKYINITHQIWIWSEFIVLLFNKKKRAIHDFIAGTVVIKSETNV